MPGTVSFYLQRVSIGNYVWNDANMNSIQDSGEIGIPGVIVKFKT
ncbi:MAG: hypothetical protein GY795_35570 [Desulfobacterales bacterium]|nr:hypothetical protein [Desulfobacterales bacterium]